MAASRHRAKSIQARREQRQQPPPPAAGNVPPARNPKRHAGILLAGLAGVALATAAAVYLLAPDRRVWEEPGSSAGPELQLCRQFMDLTNAGDPRAKDLLDPAPAIPDQAVSPEEADRLDAEFMLHQPLHLRAVRPLRSTESAVPRFALVAEGSLVSEHVLVRIATGTESRQRSLWNPDLVVEVQGGKIHGILARMHED